MAARLLPPVALLLVVGAAAAAEPGLVLLAHGPDAFSPDLVRPYVSPGSRDVLEVAFELPAPARLDTRITDPHGAVVRQLVDDHPFGAGRHVIYWNGLNETDRHPADGTYEVTLSATSGGGVSRESFPVHLDRTSPSLDVEVPTRTTGENVRVRVTARETLDATPRAEVAVGDAAPRPVPLVPDGDGFTGSITLPDDGAAVVRVAGMDVAGNSGTAAAIVLVDGTPPSLRGPTVVEGVAGEAGWHLGPVRLAVAATDASSGVARIEVREAADAEWKAATEWTVLTEGVTTWTARAIDANGNLAESPPLTVRIDTVAPTLRVLAPAPGAALADGRVVLDLDAALPLTCSIDAAPASPCADGDVLDLANGTHTLRVEARKPSGRAAAVDVAFLVDLVDPVVEIRTPAHGSVLDAAPRLDVVARDATGLACRLDDAPVSCRADLAGLAFGEHTLAARAVDAAGRAAEARSTFRLLETGATVAFASPRPGSVLSTSEADVRFALPAGASTARCTLDEGAEVACDGSDTHRLTGLRDGDHRLRVATDGGVASVLAFVVDTAAPEIEIVGGGAAWSRDPVRVEALARDATTAIASFACLLDGAPFAPPAVVGEGDRELACVATDGAGHEAKGSVRVRVDATDPAVLLAAPGGRVFASSPGISFDVRETNAGATTCAVDDGPHAPCSSPFVPTAGAGEHVARVRHVDAAGRAAEAGFAFLLDLADPLLEIRSPAEGASLRGDVAFEVAASDATALALRCALDGSAPAPCQPGARILSLPPGEHVLRVEATDEAGRVARAERRFAVLGEEPARPALPPVTVAPEASGSLLAPAPAAGAVLLVAVLLAVASRRR